MLPKAYVWFPNLEKEVFLLPFLSLPPPFLSPGDRGLAGGKEGMGMRGSRAKDVAAGCGGQEAVVERRWL